MCPDIGSYCPRTASVSPSTIVTFSLPIDAHAKPLKEVIIYLILPDEERVEETRQFVSKCCCPLLLSTL